MHPRVLFVDLQRLATGERAEPEAWRPADPDLARLAPRAGGALGALILLERARRGAREDAFCVAVGDAVRRGLPTAARAVVAARAPLHGGLSEGSVGGSLGRRLARVLDAVVVQGRVEGPGNVLVVDARGAARLERVPELAGLDPRAAHRALVARLGPAATLRVGPAGERGARVASLASGEDAQSFTGRGGLGAAFAARGLKALAVLAEEVEPERDPALSAALARSPRLLARARDGTFELAHLRRARGEIGADEARMLAEGARDAARERTGCAGCPTPCGWSFARPGGEAAPARFGKVQALGARLGLTRFEDALELAAACDAAGVDAKETGAALEALARARGALGDRARLLGLVADLARGEGEGWALEGGLGGGREAPGPERGIAARLGACVSTNGSDPMRTFPFLLEAGGRAALEALCDGVPLPPGAEDPELDAGKGRLCWWHESLVAALDATGFCAFSAAGLLADGALDLDALARGIAPFAGERPGRALVLWGHALVGARRELARRHGRAIEVPADLASAHAEYERWRALGFDAAREPAVPVREPAAFAREPETPAREPEAFTREPETPALGAAARSGGPEAAGAPGALVLRPTGALAEHLGAELRVALAAPRAIGLVLAELGGPLGRAGAPACSAYRGGRRLDADDLVGPGDEVDLVVAIAGG